MEEIRRPAQPYLRPSALRAARLFEVFENKAFRRLIRSRLFFAAGSAAA
jgi:hypothetical protein